MFFSGGGVAIDGGNGFEGVEVDAVGADLLEQIDQGYVGRARFGARAGIPSEDGKEYFDVAAMKVGDQFLQAGDSAGEIAQKIELVAIVNADVGINMPQQHDVNRADAFFCFGEEFVDGVFTLFGIVDGAVPHQQLNL